MKKKNNNKTTIAMFICLGLVFVFALAHQITVASRSKAYHIMYNTCQQYPKVSEIVDCACAAKCMDRAYKVGAFREIEDVQYMNDICLTRCVRI